ncbi:hypothetical protein [Halobacterium wangiae]|uniref:hypothetical protein n=1 Tax=Halobacterium wangiae TaxID=2902623 RepID=UPI001E37D356|nr:hypothetical protein [Halobacterium wangiae]
MAGKRLLLAGTNLTLSYLFVAVLFFPVTVIQWIGRTSQLYKAARRPILFSESRAERIRNDLADGMSDGAVRILEYNDIGSIPVARQTYRHLGLKAARKTERTLSTGEFIITSVIIVVGIGASIINLVPISQHWVESSNLPAYAFGWISVGTTIFGFLLLTVILVRDSVVDFFMFDDKDLSTGTPPELLTKVVWNKKVAENPTKPVHAYYLLSLAGLISEEVYSKVLSALVESMDPETERQELMQNRLPEISELIIKEMTEE